MVGVSKKLYNGVVKYFDGAATQLRANVETEDDARVLNIMDAVLDVLNEPVKDDFERMLVLAVLNETISEAAGPLILFSKLGLIKNPTPEAFIYGTIIGICNITLLQAGITTEKVKAYVEEQQDAVVIVDEQVPA